MTLSLNKEIYYSSSDQDEDIQIPQTMIQSEAKKRPRKKTFPEDKINQLSGLEVFQIFCNQKQLNALMNDDDIDNFVKIRFFWRIQYIIGEIILQVQQFLIEQNKLSSCLLLEGSHANRIALKLIAKAQKNNTQPEFLKIKSHLQAIYKSTQFDLPILCQLYNIFVKESWIEYKFEMVIKQDKKSSSYSITPGMQPPYEIDTRRNFNNLTNSTSNRGNPMGMSSVDPNKIGSSVRMTSQAPYNFSEQNKVNTQPYVQPVEKGVSCKWTSVQESAFCKIYSQQESPAVCAHLMQQKLGPDGRWKTANQIELKMYSLVEKVFKKFATLNTNNEYIKKFRQQKDLILTMPDPQIKKKIFRSIATIYQSMLNVSEEKKAVISQKILEVNRLCKDATLMNH